MYCPISFNSDDTYHIQFFLILNLIISLFFIFSGISWNDKKKDFVQIEPSSLFVNNFNSLRMFLKPDESFIMIVLL